MILRAHRFDNAGRRLLLSRGAEELAATRDFQGDARVVSVTAVSDEHGRPKLVLVGVVERLHSEDGAVAVQGGFTQLWSYEFERQQLVELTRRGLLEHGLDGQPFESLVGQVLELPLPARVSLLTFAGMDHLFVGRAELDRPVLATWANCGYDLAEFYPEQPELDVLATQEQSGLERQAGFEGVDVLFEDQPVAQHPGNDGAQTVEFAGIADLTLGLDTDLLAGMAPAVETPPETDPEAAVVTPGPFDPAARTVHVGQPDPLAGDEVAPTPAAEPQEGTTAADEVEETRDNVARARLAQGLGSVPSAYAAQPYGALEEPVSDFDELEL